MSSSLNRVTEIVDKVRHIQEEAASKGKNASKYITDRCNAIGNDEHKRLNVVVDKDTGELLSQPVCSYRYYSQLMEDYRNGVKALNYKHHAIDRHVSGFIRKYSPKIQGLEKMLDPSLPIQKLRDNLIKLRADSVTGSDFRRDLLKLKIEHHAYYMFEPKGAVKDWIRDDDKKSLNKKLHSQILVNPEWIKNLARDLLTRPSATTSDLCIGIALATGRRLTEIMKTAKLKRLDESTLMFSGQLKTKNRHLFEEVAPYEIPSMIDAEIVVKALQKLRRDTGKDKLKFKNVLGETVESTVNEGDVKDYYHNRAVQKKYESTINRAIRSTFKNGHFSHKDCRAIYTEVTYEEHHSDGEARSAYRHRVLGHSLIETQLHYEAFQLDSTVETIKMVEEGDDQEMDGIQEALVEYLSKADADVQAYVRAPKIAIMHEWLKSEVSNGLKLEQITPSYIRRHCLFDGKQLNLNTIKKYVDEFIQLDKFEKPKPKPKSKKEREIAELEERIQELQDRHNEIDNEKEELVDEREEIKERLAEIDQEEEDLAVELEELTETLEELQLQLEELEEEAEEDEVEPEEETEAEAPAIEWPAAKDIKVQAKKEDDMWHVWAEVNGMRWEQWYKGRKTDAVKALRAQYEKEQLNK
ncbi:TPA: hypothetical protein I7138_20380 [Vibrio vulnificus]|nr:hypothetical protein [Vibrio vulnificus]